MDKTVTNPYYLAYIEHIKKIEEKETNHGFMNWIQKKHTDFRKQTGISKHDRNYHNAFLKWLNKKQL